MQLAPLTIEQLADRFMLEKSPYWWAYRANSRDVVGKFREEEEYASNEEKLLDGWMQLEELIKTHAHGKLKVILKKNKSDNLDKSITLHVQWGAAPGRAAGIGSSTSYAPAFAPNPNDMLMKMLEMQEKNFERQEAAREAAHSREMNTMQELLNARFTAQNLEAEIEGMGGSTISEDMLRGFIDIAKTVLMRPAAPAAALGTLGQGSNEQVHAPEMPPPPPVSQSDEQPGHRRFSVDLALQHIAVIRKNIPEHHINDLIGALALFTQEQPEQAKQMLGMLMPNKS